MFEDSTFWLFVAPGLLLGLYAQARIKANYVRYSRVGTPGGIAGAQVARALLDAEFYCVADTQSNRFPDSVTTFPMIADSWR
jgi:Zn-dependent membrane protease YugP